MNGSVFTIEPPIAGAKSDLVFLHSDTPYVITTAEQSLFTGGSKMAAGAYKLMQQTVLALFTAVGRVQFDSTRGTEMAAAILRSGIQNETGMRRVFAISRDQVLADFQSRQSNDTTIPPEEVLSDLRLMSLAIVGDSIFMSIELKTGAAQIIKITLPVTYHV